MKRVTLQPMEYIERLLKGEHLYTSPQLNAYLFMSSGGKFMFMGSGSSPAIQMDKPKEFYLPCEWYEDIPESGVLVKTEDGTRVIASYDKGFDLVNTDDGDNYYPSEIEPLTNEEIKAFLRSEINT